MQNPNTDVTLTKMKTVKEMIITITLLIKNYDNNSNNDNENGSNDFLNSKQQQQQKNNKKPSDLSTNKKRTDLHCLFIIKLNKNLCKTKPFQPTHYLKKCRLH